jgi:hypothetical protein
MSCDAVDCPIGFLEVVLMTISCCAVFLVVVLVACPGFTLVPATEVVYLLLLVPCSLNGKAVLVAGVIIIFVLVCC